ncbi:hypothetical protein ACFL6X_02845 [Candidatus Latescibacterota bacterium]
MTIGLIDAGAGLPAYIGELFDTWGLRSWRSIAAGEAARLDPTATPVVVLPAGHVELEAAVAAYVERGGCAASILPAGAVATALGIEGKGGMDPPLQLRLTGPRLAGVAGESLPVVGTAETWAVPEGADAIGFLHGPGRDEGERVGLLRRQLGAGTLVGLAFDLPLAVLLLRQGDPGNQERRSQFAPPMRPSLLACDLGPQEPGWVPYADLLGRVLVDLVRGLHPAPLPLLYHLPGAAPGILVYSGDEDGADVAWNREEFGQVAAAGGRMNLYIIPGNTQSTSADVEAYRQHHDVGPHPNLRRLDDAPVGERIAEMVRQVRQFEDTFGGPVSSVRNHCVAWAGYLEPVEAMERLGVGMDANYFCSTFLRGRHYAPYGSFGAALPTRFCHPGGALTSVRQQHTHTMDDVYFGPDWVPYSYRFAPQQWEAILGRVFDDIVGRFHVPHAVCIHPSNWVRFSREQGRALLRQAGERQMPIWSFDQWLAFWQERATWQWESLAWDGVRLTGRLSGEASRDDLSLLLPAQHRGAALRQMKVDGASVEVHQVQRYGEAAALTGLPVERSVEVEAVYEGEEG